MSIRKSLIKLNNRLESSWSAVNLKNQPVRLRAGWYVSEFVVPGTLDHLPRLVVKNEEGLEQNRTLIGVHSGRNRMMFYLPAGQLIGYSDSIKFERLSRISSIEARFRTVLICARYLRDFFGLGAILKMVALQFQAPFERSTSLLRFYSPDISNRTYLENVVAWNRFGGFSKSILRLFAGTAKIAVLIQDEAQHEQLQQQLVAPEWIIRVDENTSIPVDADYVLPLRNSETLRPAAILMLKRAIRKASKRPTIIYTDHDYDWAADYARQDDAPQAPVFKPQPSRAYLACYNYVGPALIFAAASLGSRSARDLMDERTAYELAFELFASLDKVLHVPEALFCSTREGEPVTPEPGSDQSPWPGISWRRRQNYNVLVAEPAANNGPSVDLVIPTRDGLAVLQPCIDSILEKTDYNAFKIIVVDNGSEKRETFEYFEKIQRDARVSVVTYPGEFNYSAINNFAVAHGNSPYIALVNNDIEVIDGGWLTQMMAWAQQPEVGIVGAKLLFGDGRVQHAGVTIGMGNAAGHIHRLEEGDAPGYQLRCLATQNMMAVTAACLVTPRDLYYQVGCLDEEHLKVAYNDIDYCLRVEQSGKQVIWTPEAVLYHHESVSRGDDMSDTHIERYFSELKVLQTRWKTKGFVDKYYSRHLRISDEGVYPQAERQQSDTLVYLTEQ